MCTNQPKRMERPMTATIENLKLNKATFPDKVREFASVVDMELQFLPCTADCDGVGMGCSDSDCEDSLTYYLYVGWHPEGFTEGMIEVMNDDTGFSDFFHVGFGTLESIAQQWEYVRELIYSDESSR